MSESRAEQRWQTFKVCGILLLLSGCAFLWVALLTFHPFDWPSTQVWPHNDPPRNGCGWVGAWTAWQVFHYLGAGAYALTAILSVAAGTRLLGGPIRDWPLRIGGLTLVVTVTSAAATLLASDAPSQVLSDAGGVLGIAMVHVLNSHLNALGTLLVLVAALVVGVLLSADEVVLRLPGMAASAHQHIRTVLAAASVRARHSRNTAGEPAAAAPQTPSIGAAIAAWLRTAVSRRVTALAGLGQFIPAELPVEAAPPARARRRSRPAQDEGAKSDAPQSSPETPADEPQQGDAPAAAPDEESPKRLTQNAETLTPTLSLQGRGSDVARRPEPFSITAESTTAKPAAQPPTPVQQNSDIVGPPAPAETESAATAASATAAPAASRQEIVVRTLGSRNPANKVPPSPWPKELGDYVLPPLELLDDPEYHYMAAQEGVVREKARVLEQTLQEFRIDGHVVEIDTGPVITMFEVMLAPGIKVSQIGSLHTDIARALKTPAIRVVPTIAGKNTIGIEVPNTEKEKVRLKELITLSGVKPTKMALPLFLGKDASGNSLIADLAAMPHLLIAGTTGSGKSVCINTLVMSVLMTQRPDHVKLILVDPKMVEMSVFKEVPHLMCPIVTDMNKAEMILEWAATKMDERYELLAEAGVRHVANFNRLGKDEIYRRFNPSNEEEKAQIPTHLPYIVIIIDELADLMLTSGKQVEHHLCRIAQKSRAVGIHIILATQRPQANVVTGLIKSNLPSRVAFRVASRMDSRIVLDQNGAEVLMGQGDMLFLPPGTSKLVRAQGTYIEDDELKRILDDLKSKAAPEFHHELTRLRPTGEGSDTERDSLFDDAVAIVVETRRGSVSLLQRRLAIGYTRASRLIDQMAFAGIVGEHKGSQQREVMITADEWAGMKGQRDHEIAHGNFEADQSSEEGDEVGAE